MQYIPPTIVSPLSREDLDDVLTKTLPCWDELRQSRIFITGGTGFFGTWLLESFAHANSRLDLQAKAFVLTRNPKAFTAKVPHLTERADICLMAGDVRDFEFPGGPFSHVIHAGTTSGSPVENQEMFDTIVHGTRRVLDFASTRETRKLLFISSGAVYGPQPPDLTDIPEEYCGAPDPLIIGSAYGEGKRAAELLTVLAGKKHNIETKIARCFAFVGPHLPIDAHFAIGNFIRDALRGGPIRIGGDGTPFRSYLYASDLAIWLWTILFRGLSGRAYNVGSPKAQSIVEIAEIINSLFNLNTPIELAKRPTPGCAPSRYIPSVKRAQFELELKVNVNLTEAINRTVAWHRYPKPEIIV